MGNYLEELAKGNNRGNHRRTSSSSGGAFLNAQQSVRDIADRRRELLDEAVATVANYCMGLNQSGSASSISKISEQIATLVKDFSAEDQAYILRVTLSKLIVNL